MEAALAVSSHAVIGEPTWPSAEPARQDCVFFRESRPSGLSASSGGRGCHRCQRCRRALPAGERTAAQPFRACRVLNDVALHE